MTTAAYPGSFDPLTWGHIRLIEQVSTVFPQLTVAVGVNRNKKYLFNITERLHLARQTLAHLPNVQVVAFEGLLTRFLAEQDIKVVIRGLRSGQDMDENFLQDFFAWRQHEGLNVTPLYVPSKPAEAFLSSSLLKQALQEQADTAEMAPLASSHAVQARMLGQYILGVTGLSGSGKTHVCTQLIKLAHAQGIQAHHIDADQLVHQIYANCPEPLYTRTRIEIAHHIQTHYGTNVLEPTGTHINRKKLAEVVFANPAAKTFLEDTLYGPLTVLLRQTLRGKKGLILVDAPTLAEAGWLPVVNNNVLLVHAAEKTTKARLQQRYGISSLHIARRQAIQNPHTTKQHLIEAAITQARYGTLLQLENSGHQNLSKSKTDPTFQPLLESILQTLNPFNDPLPTES